MRAKGLSLGIWLLAAIACAMVIARTRVRTDIAAFLPHSSSMAQQALTDQVSHGAASHLVLLAIEGVPPSVLASLSKDLAARLRHDPGFVEIANGGGAGFAGVRKFVWTNRYLLSPDVTPSRFTAKGLHAALETDLGLLGSGLGAAIQSSISADPTGEALALMRRLGGASGPPTRDGAWVSKDGSRAILVAATKVAGFDIDAVQGDLRTIRTAFDAARAAVPGAANARLLETGPGVFAVRGRDVTERDVTRLSVLATLAAVFLLLFAYRSPRVLLLGMLPVASGVLAAIAAVSLDFGFVHGVTLGFGVTLIGESIDYAVYLFTQTRQGDTAHDTLARIWPTLRLGALTSIVGFTAMLFSNFTGFAQLGLFSIVGLAAAAVVTRFVLPHLVPRDFFAAGAGHLARPVLAAMAHRRTLRILAAILVAASLATLALHRGGFWDTNLENLSPIPQAEQTLDNTLRHDLGMSGQRYFAVFRAGSEQKALIASETLATTLKKLVGEKHLARFDAPSTILPSERTQHERQAALPDGPTLRTRLATALAGTPFRADAFAPFFRAVEAARTASPLTKADLPPVLALRLGSMLIRTGDGWTVIAPLHGVTDPKAVADSLASSGPPGIRFVDLNHESAVLLHTFQHQATTLAVVGSLAIFGVLLFGLGSPARVLAVAAPLAAAVIVTAALLTLGGAKLSIFMVVGFLLIVAVGSNYCLFFERHEADAQARERAVASIVLANLCTVFAYGLMSISGLPVLHDIGITVATGTFLSLVFAAVLASRDPLPETTQEAARETVSQ